VSSVFTQMQKSLTITTLVRLSGLIFSACKLQEEDHLEESTEKIKSQLSLMRFKESCLRHTMSTISESLSMNHRQLKLCSFKSWRESMDLSSKCTHPSLI
jgi:hypothetical protein